MRLFFKPSPETVISALFWLGLGFSIGWWVHSVNSPAVVMHASPSAGAPGAPTGAATGGGTATGNLPFRESLDEYRQAQKKQPGEADLHREWILTQAERLIQENDRRAGELIDSFLNIEAYDPRAMLLKARAALAESRFEAALDAAVELKQLSQAEVPQRQIDDLLKDIVARYAEDLEQREEFAQLLALYRRMTLVLPDDAGYQYKLGEVQFRLGDHADALNSLNYALYDPVWGERARILLQKVQQYIALQDGEQVALENIDGHFFVSAQIEYVDGIRLLIDTGASMTSLRPEVARRLGIEFSEDDTAVVQGANSVFNAPRATVGSMALGEVELEEIDIHIVELGPGFEADGLLGMNFLGQFRFFIDQDRELLLLGNR